MVIICECFWPAFLTGHNILTGISFTAPKRGSADSVLSQFGGTHLILHWIRIEAKDQAMREGSLEKLPLDGKKLVISVTHQQENTINGVGLTKKWIKLFLLT